MFVTSDGITFGLLACFSSFHLVTNFFDLCRLSGLFLITFGLVIISLCHSWVSIQLPFLNSTCCQLLSCQVNRLISRYRSACVYLMIHTVGAGQVLRRLDPPSEELLAQIERQRSAAVISHFDDSADLATLLPIPRPFLFQGFRVEPDI
jgi:hypothetical protein